MSAMTVRRSRRLFLALDPNCKRCVVIIAWRELYPDMVSGDLDQVGIYPDTPHYRVHAAR